jgi:hypothetical protein
MPAISKARAMSRLWVDLSPPASKQIDNVAGPLEIDAISGAEMNSHLRHALTDQHAITEIAEFGRPDSRKD